jgi:hypothetical protein
MVPNKVANRNFSLPLLITDYAAPLLFSPTHIFVSISWQVSVLNASLSV